jgi:hypothetical protein
MAETSRQVLNAWRVVVDSRNALERARKPISKMAIVEFNGALTALEALATALATSAGHLAAREDDNKPRDAPHAS